MLLDTLNEFSDAQAETTVAAHDSTNIVDLGADSNQAIGHELYLNIIVETAVTSAGAATVQFQLLTDDNAAFSSASTLWDSGAIGKATLVDGYQVCRIRVPKGAERYLKVVYTIGTAALTAGKFDAFLSPSVQDTYAVS